MPCPSHLQQLNYDKVENGKLSLEPTILSIWDILEKTVQEFVLPARARNISIHLDLEPPVAAQSGEEGAVITVAQAALLPEEVRQHRLIGDPIRIMQVLRNIIVNAIKFTPSEGKCFGAVARLVDISS